MRLIEKLRQNCTTQYLTEQQLRPCFTSSSAYYSGIARLVKTGELIRLKPGMFVFAEQNRNTPLGLYMIANMLYGPSYISLESALSYYGLIPEGLVSVTSINNIYNRIYNTKIGRFIYRVIKAQVYFAGVHSVQINKAHCIMALPEKALLDKLYLDLGKNKPYQYLTESLRIEPEALKKLNWKFVLALSKSYNSKSFGLKIKMLRQQVLENL